MLGDGLKECFMCSFQVGGGGSTKSYLYLWEIREYQKQALNCVRTLWKTTLTTLTYFFVIFSIFPEIIRRPWDLQPAKLLKKPSFIGIFQGLFLSFSKISQWLPFHDCNWAFLFHVSRKEIYIYIYIYILYILQTILHFNFVFYSNVRKRTEVIDNLTVCVLKPTNPIRENKI